MSQRIVIIGATGSIGRPLCSDLIRRGHAVIVFSRDAAHAKRVIPDAAEHVSWQPHEMNADARAHLNASDAVVYLAGGPLFDGQRHTRADVEHETEARVAGVNALVDVLATSDRPPRTLIAASSVGYYGYQQRADDIIDETVPGGTDWWGQSSAAIEKAALAARDHGVRTVVVRTGYVLTTESLQSQVAQFQRHFGGWIGRGRGWTPWIHIADEVGIITAALEQSEIDGPINATAPEPVRSREFAQILGRVLGRRAWLPVPTPLVRMGLGAVTDIIVNGKRVTPAKLLSTGFDFHYPRLELALRDLVGGEAQETVSR